MMQLSDYSTLPLICQRFLEISESILSEKQNRKQEDRAGKEK